MVEKSLNAAPETTDVQEDDTRNVASVKVVEEQLASLPAEGRDRNEVENSLMDVDPKDASTPRLDGAMVKRFIRFFKEGLSKGDVYEKAKTPLGPASQPPTPKGNQGQRVDEAKTRAFRKKTT